MDDRSPRFYLRTLGRLALHAGGTDGEELLGASKALALVAYLADRPGREETRGHLAALLWPGETGRGRRSLRQAIYYLAKRAGAPLLETDGDTLRLREDRLDTDLWRFSAALEANRWREAVELHRGRFLADFDRDVSAEFRHWTEARQERVWSGYKGALHRLVSERLEERRPDEAVRWARRLAEVNPLDEAAQTALVTALAARGDPVAALQAYEAYRTLLEKELDDEPGPGLRERAETLREEVRANPPLSVGRARERARESRASHASGAAPESRASGAAPESGQPGESEPEERTREDETRKEGLKEGLKQGLIGTLAPAAAGVTRRAVAVVLLVALGGLATWAAWRKLEGAGGAGSAAVPAGEEATTPTAGGEGGTRAGADGGAGPVLWLALAASEGGGIARLALPPGGTDAGGEGGEADGGETGTDGGALRPVLGLANPIPSPTGRRVAVQVTSPDGIDLVIYEPASGDTIFRFTHPSDDVPLAWSPDGRRLVLFQGMRVDTGYARWLAVLDVESGEPRVLSPHFFPRRGGVAWSPDGLWIAFAGVESARAGDRGRAAEAGRAGEADRTTDADRTGGGSRAGDGGRAARVGPAADADRTGGGERAGQPDGAVGARGTGVRKDTALYLAHPDGTGLRALAPHPAWDGDPAWSPDGRWLVFASRRGGSVDLYRIRRDGSGLEAILAGPADERDPRWIDAGHLVYRRDDGTGSTLHLLDVETGETRPLANGAEVNRIQGLVRPDRPGKWIVAVRIRGPAPTAGPEETAGEGSAGVPVSPGQWIRLSAAVQTADGETGPAEELPLRWSVKPEGAAEIRRASRLLRIRDAGPLELVAELPGWRGDTARLLSVPLEEAPRPALLAEDWSRGIDGERWTVYGEPRPEVVAREGEGERFPRAFVSRGDENYESGVATREAFDASEGLTLEAWGRLPEGAGIFNDFALSFQRSLAPEGTAAWGFLRDGAAGFMLMGNGPQTSLWTWTGGRVDLPPPDDPHAWHRYALQIAPDGTVSLIIDGRLFGRSPEPVSLEEGERLHAVVAGRARDVPVAHGPVTLWRGMRYVPQEGPAGGR